jgi:glycosyltransferase involved in cell wall biosynthesis
VRDGETGRLVAPRDPAALAAVLAELAGDRAQRERLGAAAAAEIPQRFSRERLLAEVHALYDRLLSR